MELTTNPKVMESEPKKKRSKRTASSSLSAKEEVIDEVSARRIQEVLEHSALLHNIEEVRKQKLKNQDTQALAHIAEEYMKCFVILGYDLHGDKVTIVNANNSQDQDSLVEHLLSSISWILPQVRSGGDIDDIE
jgi:hypothetical protein